MPVLHSSYTAPLLLKYPHVQTIFPSLFRKIDVKPTDYEHINTSDHDILDLDWYKTGSTKLVVLSHGLEGNSNRPYIKGMTAALLENGFDVLAWNYRSCGRTRNVQPRLYHSGSYDDLHCVVEHAAVMENYAEIMLVGFSMGGNITLNYLGQDEFARSNKISRAVCISVPCDLDGSAKALSRFQNKIYMKRFLTSLKKKLLAKQKQFPALINLDNYDTIKNFHEFDNRYTAPLHGYKNAGHYYQQASSLFRLSNISIPTLLLNSLDDPFLSSSCFPFAIAEQNPQLFLETTKRGGHVGFIEFDSFYFSEKRAALFLKTKNI